MSDLDDRMESEVAITEVLINDVTGKLHDFFRLIADEIPECRKIVTGRRFNDEQIDVLIIFEIEGKPLECRFRGESDALLDKSESRIDSLKQNIKAWQYIGPPYEVIETDTEYEAFYTPEQKRRIAEVFSQ